MKRFERYQRNMQAFTKDEIDLVHTKSACVIGCGGLGGHVLNSLARFGVRSLTIIDSDVFDASNLNRQVFCLETNLGKSKALATKDILHEINSEVQVVAYHTELNQENANLLLSGHDVVVDCMDSIPTRLIVEQACAMLRVPLVHGAIAGFLGQVTTVFPGQSTLNKIYGRFSKGKGVEEEVGNPSFIPQLVGAIQSSEVLKLLAGREDLLEKKLLYIDLETYSFDIIEIS